MSDQRGTLAALGQRAFRRLWTASLISNLGGLVQIVGATWVMTTLTPSQSMVSLVQSSMALPIMLGGFAAGVLADNYERRSIMLFAQVLMMIVSALLVVLAFEGLLNPWTLLGLTFLIGCGTAVHTPAWQASIGDLVPRELVPAAVAANGLGINLTRTIGPALGGLLVAAYGPTASFAVNALAYIALILVLLGWKPAITPRTLPPERFDNAVASGLRYFLMSPNLMNVVARNTIFGFAAIAIPALLPLVAKQQLSGGALLYGLLLGAFGAGAVTGALLVAPIRVRLSDERLCRIGFNSYAVCCCALALSGSVPAAAAAVFVAGMFWLNIFSMTSSIVQLATPRWVLARMLALSLTGVYGGMALGGWLFGLIAEHWGLGNALIAAALVHLAGAIWGVLIPLPAKIADNLDPLNAFSEPSLRLDLKHRSGPISISIAYEIPEANVSEFLHIMIERRRTRLRDNAKNWVLMRDLENPDLWKETYHFPTWLEYVRHNSRRTLADGDLNHRLADIHVGPMPLRVERMIERHTVDPRASALRIDP